MTRGEKAEVVSALQERFSRTSIALVATNRGLSVADAVELRRKLRAADGEYKVAKLTLIRRALPESGFEGLSGFLDGPRGLVFGYSNPVRVAKTLVDFAEENKKLEIEGATFEGQVFPRDQVKALANMPGLEELRARAACQVLAPARRLASTIKGPASRIAGAIAALVEKLEGNSAEGRETAE